MNSSIFKIGPVHYKNSVQKGLTYHLQCHYDTISSNITFSTKTALRSVVYKTCMSDHVLYKLFRRIYTEIKITSVNNQFFFLSPSRSLPPPIRNVYLL